MADEKLRPAHALSLPPFLWSPTIVQEQQLRQDWEELMELIALGKIEQITARLGQYLQLRPQSGRRQSPYQCDWP